MIRQDHGFGSPRKPHQLLGWILICLVALLCATLVISSAVARTVSCSVYLSFDLVHKYLREGSKILAFLLGSVQFGPLLLEA